MSATRKHLAAVALAGATLLLSLPSVSPAAVHRTGDQRVTYQKPKHGFADSCSRLTSQPAPAVPWVSGSRYLRSLRPNIPAEISWPLASFSLNVSGSTRSFSGNGLPVHTRTGVFPAGGSAASYTAADAPLAVGTVTGSMPARPSRAERPQCIDPAQPVGIASNGVPIFPSFDRAGHNLVIHQLADACGGHTDSNAMYVYRGMPFCLLGGPSSKPSPLIGYARDGNPIYGPRGAGGHLIKERDLDACHGRTVTVDVAGRRVRQYRYYATTSFPYTVGCFHSVPAGSWQVIPNGATQLQVATTPKLYPDFSPTVSDYVIRCIPGQQVNFHVVAPRGTTVKVGSNPALAGTYDTLVPMNPGQETSATVTNASGSSTYYARCLPSDFPLFTSKRSGNPQAAYYIVTPTIGPVVHPYVIVFDDNGVPVWWYAPPSSAANAMLLPNGDLGWSRFFLGTNFSTNPNSAFEIHSLDGTLAKTVTSVGPAPLDFHELQVMPNGDYLIEVYQPRDHVDLSPYGGPADATVVDGEIQEVAPDGHLVWSWNLKDHISLSETDWSNPAFGVADSPTTLPDGRKAYDIDHVNALQPAGNGKLIFSARHLGAVYEIDMHTGNILWKLGGTTTPQSLTIVGDPDAASDFGGQHDARLLPDGTVTVHDNGTGKNRAPRALRFKIDTAAKTATLVESVADPAVSSSGCCGSARKLPGGDWVMSWGLNPLVTELTPSGQRVYSVFFDQSLISYRADPVLPGELSADALRAGMNHMAGQ